MEDQAPLTPDVIEKMVLGVLTPELRKDFEASKEVDFSFNWKSTARFRGNAFHQRGSISLALRLVPFEIPTFDDLGLPAMARVFARLPQGLFW